MSDDPASIAAWQEEERNDIVRRLRAVFHNDRSVELMNREAADEIERLRRRLLADENAYDIERRQNEHLQTDRNNLALEVERLRKELQEAEKLVDEYQRENADRTRWENQ